MIMTFFKLSRLGYPSMYFCSLATTVCCTRQSACLLNQSQNENKIRTFDRLTGIAENQNATQFGSFSFTSIRYKVIRKNVDTYCKYRSEKPF